MRSEQSVTAEIRGIVQAKLGAGLIVQVDWLTTEILAAKDGIEGDDSDFYRVCAIHYVHRIVKREIGRYAPKAEAELDVLLPGFDHLQQGYTVKRDEEIVLVPVDMLTDAEIEARAQEYEAMAAGCIAHAAELRSFKKLRDRAA